MKIKGFWDIAPCSLVGVHPRFRGAYCLHHQGETSVYSSGTTRRYIPKGSHVHINGAFISVEVLKTLWDFVASAARKFCVFQTKTIKENI
jgi:hypothetical protein